MDIFSQISNMMNMLTNHSFIGKLTVGATALLTAYFAPIAGLLFACFACTLGDLVYGLKVAKKAGKKLTSSKSWRGTINKIKQEFAVIMLAHLVEHSVMGAGSITLLSGGATVLICLTELWSILENLNTLDPDGPWRMLGKFLRKKGEDYAGINIKVTENGKLDIETTVNSSDMDNEQ